MEHAVKRLSSRMRPFVALMLGSLVILHGAAGAESRRSEPQYAAPTRPDRIGRMLAAVQVNGSGPYRFIIDLGANRSVLSSELAQVLGVALDTESKIIVHGVTGSAEVPMARVAQLRVGDIVLVDQKMPVLAGAVFAGADGILGIDGLQQARIEVDFGRDRVTIAPSNGRRTSGGYLTVPATMIHKGLLLVPGRVGNVETKVIIDTGAEYTIGNMSLQAALANDRGRSGISLVSGATPGTVNGTTRAAPSIAIGQARLQNVPVTFTDLHIFNLWGFTNEPALILGMDVLGTVQKFVVDYGRREFLIKTYRQSNASVDRCQSGNCGTRLKPRS
jgi:predicted aspartyl protease